MMPYLWQLNVIGILYKVDHTIKVFELKSRLRWTVEMCFFELGKMMTKEYECEL